MKNFVKLFMGLVLLSGLFYACSKDDSEDEIAIEGDEALTVEESLVLENFEEALDFNENNVVLPNGLTIGEFLKEMDVDFYDNWLRSNRNSVIGPQDARNLLISKLTAVALNLTNRSKHQYPDEGENKPAQSGLAYSWGGKDHTRRIAPPGPNTVCEEEIYGLDCSGFIHQLFENSGVDFIIGPANSQRNPSTIKNAITSAIPELDVLEVEDLGELSTNKFETGDIIYWLSGTRANHIGIVLKNTNGQLAVFQSNGTPGKNQTECDKNLGSKRGPRRILLSDPYWFGATKSYGIVRFNAKISGKWDFYFRCAGTTTDFFVEELEFPTGNVSNFNLIKPFIDLDGSSNVANFEFLYDNTTNTLSSEFIITDASLPDFERRDRFSVRLERDDTGYIVCENLYFINGSGCTIEARLVNKESLSQ